VSAEHDPEAANPEACGACRAGATGFDHDAVRSRRPKDFEAQVRGHVEQIAGLDLNPSLAADPVFVGIRLHPDARRRARRWLRAHPA
jgi:hypothetical protein